jgi:hypothetical protein
MQPYDVLEDDTRDWNGKAQKKLLTKSLAARLQQQVQQHHEQVNWELVSSLARSPRGIPVPITRADASVDEIVANAPHVQNLLPEGSTWDGRSDLPMDESTFNKMVSEVQPSDTDAHATPAARTVAPAAPPPTPPKNGS